jgi:hypothetical protein
MNNIYDILTYNYDALVEAVAKLNRRAVKLNCQPLRLRIIREYKHERKSSTGAKFLQARMEIELLGETPKFAGWSLLAVVEMQENGENLVRAVPGKSVPESYRQTDTHCDHCKSGRKRKEVFILAHDDGRVTQVGRQCIADFLGHVSTENLAMRASWEFSAHDSCNDAGCDDYCGKHGEYRRDIAEYMTTAAVVIRRIGWCSNAAAFESGKLGMSTSQITWTVLLDSRKSFVQDWIAENDLHAEERDEKLAQEALEWARSLPRSGVADYLYNLGVACRRSFVNSKIIGLVASAIVAYQRHLETEAELKTRRRQNFESKHVGEIGKRRNFEKVVVQRMRYFESEFGVRTFITFKDSENNILIWWASKTLDDVEEGDVVNLRGTIKAHNEFHGILQTELNRVVISSADPSEIPAAKSA